MNFDFWDILKQVIEIAISQVNINGGTWFAILALLVTIFHGFETRRHNKLTVRPILRFDKSSSIGWNTNSYIKLVNAGYGPAIIKSIEVFIRDRGIANKYIKIDITTPNWSEEASKILIENQIIPENLSFKSTYFEDSEPILPNEQIALLEYTPVQTQSPESGDMYGPTLIHFIRFKVIYSSVYNQKFTLEG